MTGGAGFIGSHLVGKLLELGNNVICLDNFDPFYDVAFKRQNIAPYLSNDHFKLIEGSILDSRALGRCMRDVDVVFHLAARASVIQSMKEPIATHHINATGTLKVLEAARAAGVSRVVNISSSAVYGKVTHLPLSESLPAIPLSFYGASKICAENYCDMYRETYGMSIVSLRYFNVYGPRMRPDLAIALFAGKAIRNEDITIFGDGRKSRDFIYVDDAVMAALMAAERGTGVYNIGSGEAASVKDLAERIVDTCNSRSRIMFIDSVAGEMEHTLADTSHAEAGLGFRVNVSLDEGLRMYLSSMPAVHDERTRRGTGSDRK